MAKILIVEDEENLRFSIAKSLKRAGHEIEEVGLIEDAYRAASEREFDAVLTDINLPDDTGVSLLERLRTEGFDGAIVLITAYGTVESAVAAMKQGADDYLQKPLSLEELTVVMDRALEHRRLKHRVDLYDRLERAREPEVELIGASDAWLSAVQLAERLATMSADSSATGADGAPATILLVGETGVGKSLLARHVHAAACAAKNATRAESPFVHVECAAQSSDAVERELFGSEGGAERPEAGLFEIAEGGAVFLDEISAMSSDLQARLLHVFERGVYRRIGGSIERRVRAQVIAATNQDLEKKVAEERFRQDLFYRLNAFTIDLPPLRDRGDDVVLLAESALERLSKEMGRPAPTLSVPARIALKRHQWPGNVRELNNVTLRAMMLSEGDEITPTELGLSSTAEKKSTTPASGSRNGELVFDFESSPCTAEEVEKALIRQALEHSKGNVSRAAKLIGMNRSSFRYRLERFGLEKYPQEIGRK